VELAEFGERLAKKHGYPVACFATRATATSVDIMAARYHEDRRVSARRSRSTSCSPVLKAGGVITGEHGS
jgi:hypothetical protein